MKIMQLYINILPIILNWSSLYSFKLIPNTAAYWLAVISFYILTESKDHGIRFLLQKSAPS